MKRIFVILLGVLLVFAAGAQQSLHFTEKDYARNPLWIGMIKDTTTNFFEAEKAYKIYFKNHDKPSGENEDIGEHAKREKHPSRREQRKMQADNRMRIEVKKYEHWRDMMRPYVQADGRILTPSERLKIWNEQKVK